MDLGRHLDHFPAGLASRICLINHSWGILDTWPKQRSCELYELHSCALCRVVSHRGLFPNIPSVPLILEIALFQWLTRRLMTMGKDRNKDRFKNWQLCGVWKLPLCDHINEVHAEVRLLYQSVCQSLCCGFHPSWMTCMLSQERKNLRIDILGIQYFQYFSKTSWWVKSLSVSATTGTKTALIIIQLWFNYFVHFLRHLA